MFAMLIELTVMSEHRQTLVNALTADGSGSLRDESGTLRFDLYEDPAIAGRFYLIEAYADEAALQAHLNGTHYPPVARVLQSLRDQGAITSRTIARPNGVFLRRATGWSPDGSQ
ncbi:MAG: antibiotic biosynthesis monooxygenase [Dehalococcoidia bacterium]|nr:antibiotic biosynthesis monooxygenase [Dehalococcoidia bacterium]